jgi:hypothetical protein
MAKSPHLSTGPMKGILAAENTEVRLDESKMIGKRLKNIFIFIYNWTDLENSYALLDEKNKHDPGRSPL